MSDMFDHLCPGVHPDGIQVKVGQLWSMAGELYLVIGLSLEPSSTRYEKNRAHVFANLYHSDGTEMKVSVSMLDSLLAEIS